MNICPECGHDLVNIIYGFPKFEAIQMAKEENIALGGCNWQPGLPTLYCYGCHGAFPKVDIPYDDYE